MSWTLDGKDEADAIKEINTLSDRAAAILAGAILDDRLGGALRGALRDHRKNAQTTVQEMMFDNMAPLGTFSAKINLGLMIGLYGPSAWRDLHYIRDIRNGFAHDPGMRDFRVDRAESLAMNLKGFAKHTFPRGTPEAKTPRGVNPKMFEEELAEQLADARRRYLLCVRVYLLALSFPLSGPTIHSGIPPF
jgi:hypothetical protein